jgi:hypothetical protein
LTKLKNFFTKLPHWETWHYLVKYIPIMPVWLWYCARARSFWFFTPSNPTITFGGFEGESKMEMYSQLPEGSYPRTIYIEHSRSFDEVGELIKKNNISYPFAVKPDVGMMGFMFRTITDLPMLRQYHEKMPADYLIQEYVDYPLELSVFYYRFPDEQRGNITGFIRKEYLQVTGDGQSTLFELIENYSRVRYRREEMRSKHKDRLNDIISKGEVYVLSHALNLSRGGRLVSLADEKDERLLKVFDELSHYNGNFYYGRYDVKCTSIEDLKNKKNFCILEFNGCGAEPHHIYGNNHSLLQAYRIVLQHWKVLYGISRHNHENGIYYWNFTRGWKFLRNAKRHFRTLKQLDLETQL